MTEILQLTNFVIKTTFVDLLGQDITLRSFRFSYSTPLSEPLVATFDGEKYSANCLPLEDGVMVLFEKPLFNIGRLSVTREYVISSPCFSEPLHTVRETVELPFEVVTSYSPGKAHPSPSVLPPTGDDMLLVDTLVAQGIQGQAGASGADGAQGPQGIKGEPGPKGDKGDKGDTGPQGVAGPQGLPGVKGDQGPKGDKGDQGEVGPQGETGPQGLKGDVGPTGSKGATGPQGPEGSIPTCYLDSLNAMQMEGHYWSNHLGQRKALYHKTLVHLGNIGYDNQQGNAPGITLTVFDANASAIAYTWGCYQFSENGILKNVPIEPGSLHITREVWIEPSVGKIVARFRVPADHVGQNVTIRLHVAYTLRT